MIDSQKASDSTSSLLLEIARCPIIDAWYAADSTEREKNSCNEIISYQVKNPEFNAVERKEFQAPEPWRGHLKRAPLLFVSSNPSIGPAKSIGHWNDADLVSFHDGSFDREESNSCGGSVVDGAYIRNDGGSRGKYIRFWGAILNIARELMPSEKVAIPGTDYALTEVVHCKSRGEKGVNGRKGAVKPCSELYLERIVTESEACVIVVLGNAARWAMTWVFKNLGALVNEPPEWGKVCGPTIVAGRERYVVFMPHPNARTQRTFAAIVKQHDIEQLKQSLLEARRNVVG